MSDRVMTTISAKVDERLKSKLAVEARRQGKSISDLIKETLNEVDFGKREFTEVESKIEREEGVVPPIHNKLDNLSNRVGEIEDALREIGKAEVCLGEIITRQAVNHEKKRLSEVQREDAHRVHLQNLVIRALEKIADKDLEECKGHHPRWSE